MTHTTCYWPAALVPVGKNATQPTTVDAKGVLNVRSFRSYQDSAVFVDEQNILVSSVASSGLLEITKACAAHTVRVGRVVVKDAASFTVKATHHHKVALVIWLPAKALLTHREETAVFDRRGAQLTHQQHCVDQHDGHMTLLQVTLDLLNRNRAFFHQDSFAFSLQK